MSRKLEKAVRDSEIVRLHQEGSSLRAIADQVGLSYEGVRLILIGFGLGTARDDVDVAAAWRLYQHGWTMDAIAKRMEVSPSCICMAFKRHGLKARRVGRPRKAHPLHC